MHKPPLCLDSKRHAGYSIIELMAALLILSFGVLSALGLQVVASNNVQNGNQRVMATYLANDLLNRIRANQTPMFIAALKRISHGVELGGASLGENAPVVCLPPAGCSPDDMALLSLWQWERWLDGFRKTRFKDDAVIPVANLKDAAACIYSPQNNAAGRYLVVIVWRGASRTAPSPLSNTETDNCANDNNRYGVNNAYRRVVSMTSMVAG